MLGKHRRGEHRRSALGELLARDLAEALPAPEVLDLGPLREAWRALRPDDRDVLGLVTWDGLSLDQVARVIGCSRTAAKLRVHRARRRFAKLLAAGSEWKPATATGHVRGGRTPALPGTGEL